MKSMRIGLIGGSFDPIHIGHLILAEVAREELKLDQVLFIPAYQSPLKKDSPCVSNKDRWNMIQIAISGNAYFSSSKMELERQPPSYTIDTIEVLKKQYSSSELWLIIGADAFQDFLLWHKWEEIIKLVKLGVGNRPGFSSEIPIALKSLEERVDFFLNPNIDISSRLIRERISRGKSVRYLLPEGVFEYLKSNDLYGG